MQIMRLTKSPASCNWLTRRVPEIIDALGKPEFESRLFSATRSAIGCDLLRAVTLGGGDERRLIFVAGDHPAARSDDALRRPAPDWDFDPSLDHRTSADLIEDGVLILATMDDPGSAPSRWAGAGSAPLERLALIRRHGEVVICLSLYRRRHMGPFEVAELQRLDDASELIVALIAKHEALLPNGDSPGDLREHYVDRLRQIAPNLTQREREVCACIATGLSSEAIALTLDIKLNTVLTHRKHAYNRLNISSQNELLRKVLTSPQPAMARRHTPPAFGPSLAFEAARNFPIAAPAA